MSDERIAELANKYRIALIRLGATDADFVACGVAPPTQQERERALDDSEHTRHQ